MLYATGFVAAGAVAGALRTVWQGPRGAYAAFALGGAVAGATIWGIDDGWAAMDAIEWSASLVVGGVMGLAFGRGLLQD